MTAWVQRRVTAGRISPPAQKRFSFLFCLKLVFLALIAWEVWRHINEIPFWMLFLPVVLFVVPLLGVAVYLALRRRSARRRRFRTLSFNSKGLHYKDRAGKQWSLAWDAIVRVRVYKKFGFSSPLWHDTDWLITLQTGETTCLYNESEDHKELLAGFCKYLPGFDLDEAKRACGLEELGKSTCYVRRSSRR